MLATQLGPIVMFIAGIALLTTLLIRRTYKHIGRSRKRYDNRPLVVQPRPDSKWSGAKADASARIDRQQVELAEMNREVHGQIDSKILVLRELIAQSQQQIDRLEKLLAEK